MRTEESARTKDARPANILDVAALAGVSRTTVSRVLNHPQLVPSDTIERVHDAIATLKFKPNTRARSMRTGRSDTIALLVGDASQPFQSALAKAVARAAEARGLSVLLCDLDHNVDRLVTFLRRLPQQGVDGIVIATADDLAGRVDDLIRETREAGTPVVVSGREGDAYPHAVGVDFASAAQTATSLLLERGSTRPLLLIGDAQTYIGARWVEGYLQAVAQAGAEKIVLQSQFSDATSTELALEQLTGPLPADGVVAGTVPLALGAMRAAHRAGIRVPEDLAIVACEEVALAELVTPAITTIAVTAEASGEALIHSLSQLIHGGEPASVMLPFLTQERDTTRPPTAV